MASTSIFALIQDFHSGVEVFLACRVAVPMNILTGLAFNAVHGTVFNNVQ